MAVNLLSDAKLMKALPIKSIEIFGKGIDSGNSWVITTPNLLDESNIIIEDITIQNDCGVPIPIGQKITATIYYVAGTNELPVTVPAYAGDLRADSATIRLGEGLEYGRNGAYSAEGSSQIEVNNIGINQRGETVQGFYRHVMTITATTRRTFAKYDSN